MKIVKVKLTETVDLTEYSI